jgi:hypothetical protein
MTEGQVQKARLPPRWIIRSAWSIHRGLHRMTGGRFGLRPARPDRYGIMRVTVPGRRSGQDRSVILGYLEDGWYTSSSPIHPDQPNHTDTSTCSPTVSESRRPGSRRVEQRRHRRPAGDQPGHGPHPCQPSHDQTRRQEPCPTRCNRLSIRLGHVTPDRRTSGQGRYNRGVLAQSPVPVPGSGVLVQSLVPHGLTGSRSPFEARMR